MQLFSNLRQNWISSSLLSVTLLSSLTLGATEAKAIDLFTGPYAPNNWTTDQTATGTVTQDTSTLTMEFTSGSQGNYIDRKITIDPTTVQLTFNWNFVSLETANIQSVGYVLNNAYTILAYSSGIQDADFNPVPQSGTGALNVVAGDSFAFRIQAEQASSSGGEYAITNFNATPVPWETDALPVVGTTLLFGIGIWKKCKSSNSNNRDLK